MNMEIEAKLVVEIEDEAGRGLLVDILKDDYEFISEEIKELAGQMKSGGKVSEIVVKDFNNAFDVRDAIDTLLAYYMVHEDYVEFKELQRVYGNV